MSDFVPVNEPLLSGNERKYLEECLDTGWISSEGPFVERFEQEFARVTGRQHAIATTSGTASLDAVVAALSLGPGDEVIVPTFTIISCLHQIVRSGATPVLVDCEPDTWNMNTALIEASITPRTKAIMAVHIYGLPVDIAPIEALAARYDLTIIEDAAEMLGQRYHARPCGSLGDVSIFSFYPNKLVTTGEGGMIVTDDDALAERCRSLRNLCFAPARRFVHEELGYNFRMTNLQAALGLAQLEKLDEHIAIKRHIGQRYDELLGPLDRIQTPLPNTEFAKNIYWVYGIVLKENARTAEDIMVTLRNRGIGTRPFFYPMHLQPVFQKMGLFRDEHHPVSERLADYGFYIPSGLALTDEQLERSAAVLTDVLS